MRPTGILRSVAAAAILVLLTGALASSVGATPNPNSAVLHPRVFNDCPGSILTTVNSYPSSIIFDDADLECFGFANLHTWRLSTDGATYAQFANGDNFRFGADLLITGATHGEAGLQISPWWSADVDGRFNVRTTDGEIACFGGRMPFYSFTGVYGLHYAKGNTIHLQITYLANDNTAANPARIEYQVTYMGTTYSSGFLPFDQGNPAEDPPHGLWGMLTPAYVGGHLQAFLQGGNPNAQVRAEWSNISFQALTPQTVAVDIKPGSCPNAVNIKKKGVMTVAVLGSADFDVHDIDASSVQLAGKASQKAMIDDVSTPYDGNACGCTDEGGDGYDDLVLKFSSPDFMGLLAGSSFRQEQTLRLTGFLTDGTPISGSDCVVVVGVPKEIGMGDGSQPGGDAIAPLSLNVRTEGPRHQIEYVTPKPSEVTLTVFDVSGRIVDRLVRSYEAAGTHNVEWNASSQASGIYFYQLKSGDQTVTKKAVVVKR